MTRNDMAMRWSIWVITVPPPGAPPPCTSSQSRPEAVITPLACKPASTAASRSLSLTRNSSRPSMRVVPSANEAATARMGYSSIIEGARSAGTRTPCSCDDLTLISPTSSPPATRRFSILTSPPISCKVVIRPVRVGFNMMFSMVMSEPLVISAATMGKAADEGSPGMAMCCAVNSCPPVSEI